MRAPDGRRPGARLRERLGAPKLLCALTCAQPRRRPLRSAEAPACLRREFAELARSAGQIRQRCTWISRPPRVPKLLTTPLEGRCLASLVVESEREPAAPRAAEPQAPRPGFPDALARGVARAEGAGTPRAGAVRCAPPEPWTARRREPAAPECAPSRTPEPATNGGSLRALEPRALGPRAPLPVLERACSAKAVALAGEQPAPHERNALPLSHDAHARVFAPRTPLELVTLAQRVPPNAGASSARGDGARRAFSLPASASKREVTTRVAARLAQSVLRHASALAAPPADRHETAGFGSLSGETQPAWAHASFETNPTGPAAPLTLLLRMLGERESSRPRTPPARVESPSAPAPVLAQWVERNGQPLAGARQPIERAPTPEAPSPPRAAAEGAQQGYYPQSGALELPAAGPDGGRPLVAPPLAADTSPTLSPARFPFDAPTPIAAGTLRREAKRDETTSDDDLDVLAEKLERILSEQARRHGIGA